MTKLTTIERAYFVRKAAGANPTEPLNSIKRRYMSGVVGASAVPNMPFAQLEKLWLLSVIGGAARDFNSVAELWRQAVISVGVEPSNFLNDNKIKFYLNAP